MTTSGADLTGLTDALGDLAPTTPAEHRAASLTVCDRAHDPRDAARLLTMLGLR